MIYCDQRDLSGRTRQILVTATRWPSTCAYLAHGLGPASGEFFARPDLQEAQSFADELLCRICSIHLEELQT